MFSLLEEEKDDLRPESVMMQGDSDQHIPCLRGSRNKLHEEVKNSLGFRQGGSKKGESVLGFKRKVDI